ncbi:MAG TPA: aminoglycoside phosphotransferase family protein [Galbitalea sp.]
MVTAYFSAQASDPYPQEPVITTASPYSAGSDRLSAVLSRVAAELHRTLLGFSATLTEPTDRGYLYGYNLELQSAHGPREHRLVFLEQSTDSKPRRGVLTVPVDGETDPAAVWLYPRDPVLPALHDLTDVVTARRVLLGLGIAVQPTSIDVVAYRPGRRAVLRVNTARGSLYAKVVEPAKAESIAERHDLYRSNGLPVPKLLGWSADGVVAMSELPGLDAQSVVGRIQNHTAFLDQLEFLCTLLADVPAFNTARRSLLDRLDWYVTRLIDHVPHEAERIHFIAAAARRCGAEGRDYEYTPVTIHGDLHLGQLFVDSTDPSSISGMLDIDTAGTGDPADDAAAFYAHLIAVGETAQGFDKHSASESFRLAEAWLARWPRNANAGFADRARAIAATHLFGHALRPFSGESDAINVRLIDRAEALVTGR